MQLMSRKNFRYYQKLARKPGQTKSSKFRRLKRWLRDKRREFRNKAGIKEKEVDFLDVIDADRSVGKKQEVEDEQGSN